MMEEKEKVGKMVMRRGRGKRGGEGGGEVEEEIEQEDV